jgi:hypothetical protein
MGVRGIPSLVCTRAPGLYGEGVGVWLDAANYDGSAFYESGPTVEGWRVEASQTATSGQRRNPSSFRVVRKPLRARCGARRR